MKLNEILRYVQRILRVEMVNTWKGNLLYDLETTPLMINGGVLRHVHVAYLCPIDDTAF